MNHEFVATILAALLSSTGGVGVLQWWLAKKQKDKDARWGRWAEDSQTWYRESKHNYDVAKKEAEQAKQECSECTKELRKTRNAIYTLLEDLEDQVVPMLLLAADPSEIRLAMRTTIKKAREAL